MKTLLPLVAFGVGCSDKKDEVAPCLQAKKAEAKTGKICLAIYMKYEAATITRVCSQPILPR
ncbi:hypothetical protein [uncultured Pontibacter sp.]|uniref:hypothetical protein n=1 Tax=uncultured Pontibacter sp. TaxID=453356 RepID=UPI002616BAB8|nr:hypothetical protein [uncultured Pontibacter sp.]